MTYAEAVARLRALGGGEYAGMRPGLERIEVLLDALGNPERRCLIVQVGGTNGKGSVAAMVATILKSGGRRVGLYTSPHLVSFRERIRVNGEAIAEDAVADGVDALGTLIARLGATTFEATTALALDHFAREAVEVAVLEVGLGGRLDATTVGRPRVTVVMPIDLDHEAFLGRTLAEVAGEKAAIIRSGVAIVAAQAEPASGVILRRAAAVGVPVLLEGRDLFVTVTRWGLEGQVIRCVGPGWALDDLRLPLLGRFQSGNALVAVAAARALEVSEAAVRDGLERVRWPGRFQVLGTPPRLILDGAHNPGAARALASSLQEFFGTKSLTLIVGISQDKDAARILTALAPVARRLILTASSNPRAADPEGLRAHAPPEVPVVQVARSPQEALAMAAGPPRTPIVCVAGSLFLVGDVLRHLAGGRDKPCPIEKGADSMESLF